MSELRQQLSEVVRRALNVAEYSTIIALVGLGIAITAVALVAPGSDLRDWLRANYEDLLIGLLVALVFGGGLILAALKRIENGINVNAFRRIDEMISQLDGRERLLSPELRKASSQLEHFFNRGVFILYGHRSFQEFWLTAIRAHSGADIIATSLASTNFFWNADDIHDAMRANVDAGGEVKRLFFLNQDEPTEHDLAVMNALPDAREIALVDKTLRFGWRVEVSTDDVQRAEVMTKREDLDAQYKRLEALFAKTDTVKPLRTAPLAT